MKTKTITFLLASAALAFSAGAAETNELLNLAGVSSASDSVSIQDYFGEGPFGALKTPSRAIYSLGGEDTEAGPDLRNAEKGAFGKVAPVTGGKAYALTATGSGEWPGVIGVQGDGVFFGPDANFASIRIQNRGTTTHAFRLSMERSASGETPPPLSRRLPRTDAISAPELTFSPCAFTNIPRMILTMTATAMIMREITL